MQDAVACLLTTVVLVHQHLKCLGGAAAVHGMLSRYHKACDRDNRCDLRAALRGNRG